MRWTVQDRFGHGIYLTEERWQHALDQDWMSKELLETVLDTIKHKHYDPEGDILYIEFKPASSAKSIQLTENIVLRVDPTSGDMLGLAIHNYTKIATQRLADPLTGLPTTNSQALLQAFDSKPLSDFLVLRGGTIALGPALLPQAAKAA